MGLHYVPQYYLSGFEHVGRLWAYDTQDLKKFETTARPVANENKMYSPEVEAHLANDIEYPAESALDKARGGAQLSDDDRVALARYIVVLWKRVPRARQRVLDVTPRALEEVSRDINLQLSTLGVEQPELREQASVLRKETAASLERLRSGPDPRIWQSSLITQGTLRSVTVLLSMNWSFVRSGRQQFLTSDNPVWFPAGQGIAHRDSVLTLPLSTRVALVASHSGARSKQKDEVARPVLVRTINRNTVDNATRFVFAARDEHWILPFIVGTRRGAKGC